jgi:hypothetical protein
MGGLMRLVNVAPRIVRTTVSGRKYQDEWLNYIVNANDGQVDGLVIAAFAHIQDMQARGVHMTEALADYVLDTVNRGKALPSRSETSKFATRGITKKPTPSTSVYFLQWGDRVKIGVSVDPRRRLQGLSLPPSALMFAVPGDVSMERALHDELAPYRIGRTEWFHAVAEVMAVADRVRRDHAA